MSKLPFPKAVLFDFDGVVVDSANCHDDAWASAFREIFNKEICPFPRESHAGKAPYLIADYFAEFGGDVSRGAELNKLKQEHILKTTVPPKLLPGAVEIQQFLEENKIPHGIASNAYSGFVQNSVNQTGIGFKICMGVDQFSEPKPSPVPYLTLAERLGVKKEDYAHTIIFEDSLTGMRAAAATGMVAVGVLTQYSKEELLANGAVKVFPTLLEAYQEIVSL
ncbi:HAD superfamily hydrolase (TIGR01509 family) [Wenyingzhuangia heitensis]|uniref:HAD superfamily hydrolase (TIGR01509 family) n=1 Tax=Wenyingzhuangia heitensis TaxID=1487859 RepID=A0ABX0UA88_9FLAO|nr:HAD family phosphatase [Wenyingzhuangia heitensis]NIJ45732.1 HAD superfamily hydrolase (TIGR01509 family) [Wenyingzhuangia heitensis]